jgi:hypothetical protein
MNLNSGQFMLFLVDIFHINLKFLASLDRTGRLILLCYKIVSQSVIPENRFENSGLSLYTYHISKIVIVSKMELMIQNRK